MSQTIRTFLMFPAHAELAMQLYASLFDDAKILEVTRYGADGPGPEGSLYRGELSLGGQIVSFTDTFVTHDFTFTPATSFFVDLTSVDELDRIAAVLAEEGGQFLMAPGEYGFSKKFAWVADRFGISWQLSVA